LFRQINKNNHYPITWNNVEALINTSSVIFETKVNFQQFLFSFHLSHPARCIVREKPSNQ